MSGESAGTPEEKPAYKRVEHVAQGIGVASKVLTTFSESSRKMLFRPIFHLISGAKTMTASETMTKSRTTSMERKRAKNERRRTPLIDELVIKAAQKHRANTRLSVGRSSKGNERDVLLRFGHETRSSGQYKQRNCAFYILERACSLR